jgi:hypothetical protein
MRKVSVKAVLIGGITDVVLSAILGIPLGIYVMASRGIFGLPKEQMQAATVSAIHGSAGLYAIQLIIGLGCSVLGGYVAARIAKHDELLNGIVASWLCVAFGIYSLAAGKSSEPVVLVLLLIAVTPACYLLGSYFRLRSVRASGAST